MAVGKPLNKNAHYAASAMGSDSDVDMTREFQGNEPQQQAQAPAQPVEQEFTEQEEVAEQEQPEQEEVQEQAKPVENDKEYNFKAIREAKEKAEKERDELVRYFMELQKQQTAPKDQPKAPVQEEDDFQIDEEALLDGRYGKKVYKEIKALKNELNSYKTQYTQQSIESRIKQQLPDFDNVVSAENIAQLKEQYPHFAQSLHETKDLYAKAVSAYDIIKKFGIYKTPEQVYQHNQVKQNLAKPRPLQSVAPQEGNSPLQQANMFAQGLTPELKRYLQKEMEECSKRM